MKTFRLVQNITINNNATYSSSSVEMDMAPDEYGTLAVTHGGARLSDTAAVALFLQGSLDGGTTWFDIEVLKPSDTAYKNGNLGSWCRVIPLAPLVRLTVTNTSGANFTGLTAWIID
jgi:hypothetical protein